MTQDELNERFDRHVATENESLRMSQLRVAIKSTAELAVTLVPNGREQTLMLTELENALMWGTKGIVRN